MQRLSKQGTMVLVSQSQIEKSRIDNFHNAISKSGKDDLEAHLENRISNLNQVSGQIIGNVPLWYSNLSGGVPRTSETDWTGTPLQPIFTHTGDEQTAATLLGSLIKDWFLRNANGKWYATDTRHRWRGIDVNVYLRKS